MLSLPNLLIFNQLVKMRGEYSSGHIICAHLKEQSFTYDQDCENRADKKEVGEVREEFNYRAGITSSLKKNP